MTVDMLISCTHKMLQITRLRKGVPGNKYYQGKPEKAGETETSLDFSFIPGTRKSYTYINLS